MTDERGFTLPSIDLGGGNVVSAIELIEFAKAMGATNWEAMLKQLTSGNVHQIFNSAETIAGFVSFFIPPAIFASYGLKVLNLIVIARELGLWAPADPQNPAMLKETGPEGAVSSI